MNLMFLKFFVCTSSISAPSKSLISPFINSNSTSTYNQQPKGNINLLSSDEHN